MSLPSESSLSTAAQEPQEFSPKERALLLRLAHESITRALAGREAEQFSPSLHLSELRGVFTTLYLRGKLRGCVGYPLAVVPLHRGVFETARAAAFEDPRFIPVTAEEAPEVGISISVLSPLRLISADEVEVGRHGLLISDGVRRGLLLPQVAVEHGWDRVAFLEQACRKAALPDDAWRRGATLQGFTAEIFADPDCEKS
jgi:AmmeMemoRadiSam system protein A